MRRTAILLAAMTTMSACGSDSIATESTARLQPAAASASRGLAASVEHDLATLRHVTAPYHEFSVAVHAGYGAKITDCMASHEGGMGLHYGNTAIFDATVRVDEPELLLYEPQKDGRLKFVAVEYIIPYTALPRDATPPELFGQKFKQNDTFQLWGLHAWVGAENPSGVFADWNPRVTCDNAVAVSTMSH